MNVVQRDKCANLKKQSIQKNELLRKDGTSEIRGTLPISSYKINASRIVNKIPRYHFDGNESASNGKPLMGPPLGPPRSAKRKRISNSISSKPESSSSGARPRILASDSAAIDTSLDFCTPKNRPTALRYISSSSRGGYSGNRSARSTSTLAGYDASVILAISEGRGMARGEIGMAAVDLRHPHLVLCQFSDSLLYTHTMTKINFFNPVEIIVPHTFCDGVQPNQLYQLIKDQYPQINLTAVQRRHFNDAAGRQQIQSLSAPQYSAVYLQVLHKFYALTAAAAVLKYVEYIQCIVFARESLKIEYHSSENTMIIDVGTATQLELVQPLVPSAGTSCCLLGVLGPLYTIGGIRALRASILQPSCNAEFIENRLDAVQDLIESDAGLMGDLQDVIKKLTDIDKILLLCVEPTNHNMDKMGEAQLNQTLLLKTTMELVPKLVEALNPAVSGRLRKIKMDFMNPHYNEIADRIRNIIQDDAHLEKGAMGSLQRCFAVKPNINGLLDVARRTYSELIEDIQKIVEQLSETYDLPIRLNQNMMKGFHIVLPLSPKNRRNFNTEDLPPIFIQVQFRGTSVTMTTEELVVLDQQAKESLNEIQKMSNIVISSLLKELRPFMSSLYSLCENVAELDILVALAHASTIGSYIRPQFNEYMDIRNSVHPLLDYNCHVTPVPNDIFASPERNFTIITGPNMGGKSIYIKQIALMQIMAQIGCFLPATNAVLRLCDRLFSRIGFNDSVELNASTYVFEIKEIQHIMNGLTKSSLVIIDELCRGTNEEEGTSIAWAICEELIASNAFTFFTTHFTYMTRMEELYFCVVNMHAAVEESESEEASDNIYARQKRLIYKHKIEDGPSKIRNYGLTLAANTHLPEDIVKFAMELCDLITKNESPQEIRTLQENDESAIYKLNEDIKLESRRRDDSEQAIKQMIQQFKINNPNIIERLKSGNRRRNTESDSDRSSKSLRPVLSYNSNNTNTKEDSTNSIETTISKSVFDPSLVEKAIKIKESEVKSSNDLLNDINRQINIDSHITNVVNNNTIRNEEQIVHNEIIGINDLDFNVEPESEQTSDAKGIIENESNNLSPYHNDVNDVNSSKSNDEIEQVKRNQINQPSDSSSDIADALTQVLEDYSLDSPNTRNSDTMSLDEEFISGVIKDINEELMEMNIENLILTPPLEFRDE